MLLKQYMWLVLSAFAYSNQVVCRDINTVHSVSPLSSINISSTKPVSDINLKQLQALEREQRDLQLLAGHLCKLEVALERESAVSVEVIKRNSLLLEECKKLCGELYLDSGDVDWAQMQEALSGNRGLGSCCVTTLNALKKNVDEIFKKACDILASLGGGSFGTPITQADLPLTIVAGVDDGKRYVVVEPLFNAFGFTPAITIAASQVTLDFCGFNMKSDCLMGASPCVEITGSQNIVKNGTIYTSGAVGSQGLNITSTANQTLIECFNIITFNNSFAAAVQYAGRQTLLRNIVVLTPDATSIYAVFRNPLVSEGDIYIDSLTVQYDKNVYIDDGVICNSYIGGSILPPSMPTTNGSLIIKDTQIVGGITIDSPGINYLIQNVRLSAGIRVLSGEGTITDCSIMQENYLISFGIYIYPTAGKSIIKNNIVVGLDGLSLTAYTIEGSSVLVENNVAIGSINGFSVEFATGVVFRNNSSVGPGDGTGIGFKAFGSASGCSFERNHATGHEFGFQDQAAGPVNFFASNYAAINTTDYDLATGYFAAVAPVVGIAAATSYWQNVAG